jgi:HAD superfamily hydrolase (TIGR01549 family)
LAFRPGRWRGCLAETLDEHQPDHGITSERLRPFLQNGFPWHHPEIAHPELCEPEAWWKNTEDLLARAYQGVGIDSARASELARLARQRYLDASTGWQLFDDTMPTLDRLRADGWKHVIVSNHVPELTQLVEALGLADRIDAVFSSAVTGYEKPHRGAFEIALRHCGFPRRVWMVGDNPVADVAGAESAGIPAILVRTSAEGVARRATDLSAVIPFVTAGGYPTRQH